MFEPTGRKARRREAGPRKGTWVNVSIGTKPRSRGPGTGNPGPAPNGKEAGPLETGSPAGLTENVEGSTHL